MSISNKEKLKDIFSSIDDIQTISELLDSSSIKDIIFVDGKNGSDTNDGDTIKTAKASINAAIVRSDILIIVLPGSYFENINVGGVIVDKPRVTIISSRIGLAKVFNNNAAATAVFTIMADDVRIQGIYIRGSIYTEGVYSIGARTCIDHCIFKSPLENGVVIKGSGIVHNRSTVRYCHFGPRITNECIELITFNGDRLESCVIEQNEFYGRFDNAVRLFGLGVKRNLIRQNKIFGKNLDEDYGISINLSDENMVTDNYIDGIALWNIDTGFNNMWEINLIGSPLKIDEISKINFSQTLSRNIKRKPVSKRERGKDTVLVVGNGLTMGFIKYFKLRLDPKQPLNTKMPFDWNITYYPYFSSNENRFLNDAKDLKKYIRSAKKKGKEINDYSIIEEYLNTLGPDWIKWSLKQKRLYHQLSNYFALAYSHIQMKIDEYDITKWPFIDQFGKIKPNLIGIISFNYELLIERILNTSNNSYHRIGMDKNSKGLTIFKPHGSIDFDRGHETMNLDVQNGSLCFQNELIFDQLEKEKWLEPRAQTDIILPTSSSFNLELSFVKNGYKWALEKFCDAKRCIFLGLSYWPSDRPEFDLIFNSLHHNCEIIVVNRKEPKEMMDILKEQGFNDVVWDNEIYIA